MTKLSEYEVKTEDLKTNKLEQDRLANILLALTSVIPLLSLDESSDLHLVSTDHLWDRTKKFLQLLKTEDLLVIRLEELRVKGEF
jgi:hypothetical protein